MYRAEKQSAVRTDLLRLSGLSLETNGTSPGSTHLHTIYIHMMTAPPAPPEIGSPQLTAADCIQHVLV